MGLHSRLGRIIDSLVPDESRRVPVDPRIDPGTLEAFGHEQLRDFGSAHQHQLASPAGSTQALDMLAAERQENAHPPRLGDWIPDTPAKAHRRSSRRALAAGALAVAAGALVLWAAVGLYGSAAALPGEMRTTGTVVALAETGAAGGATLARPVVAFYDGSGDSHQVTSAIAEPIAARAIGSRMDVAYRASGPDGARVLANAGDLARTGVGLGLALVGAALLVAGVAGLAWGAGGWGPFGPAS
jgi:hypothetical protein